MEIFIGYIVLQKKVLSGFLIFLYQYKNDLLRYGIFLLNKRL